MVIGGEAVPRRAEQGRGEEASTEPPMVIGGELRSTAD